MVSAPSDIMRLLKIVKQLRAPEGGCDWDKSQNFETIISHTIEEAYEVAEAVHTHDRTALCKELGDLLFQVVFLSALAEEEKSFNFGDVVDAICEKMVQRHPHVFAQAAAPDWEDLKATERRALQQHGALDGVSRALPALIRAAKLSKRAARIGFDWDDAAEILEKIVEEIDEVRAEMHVRDLDRLEDEIGDVLFTTASFARKLGLDPEACLRRSNRKFETRFEAMETFLAERGERVENKSVAELEALWQHVKRTLAGRAT